MDTEKEPVRVTNYVTAVAAAVIGGVIMYLQTNDWRASVIAVLTAVIPLVSAAEVARTKVASPRTLETKLGVKLESLK
jgi:uncharacterized membrane protein YjjP (DUF1212 family)